MLPRRASGPSPSRLRGRHGKSPSQVKEWPPHRNPARTPRGSVAGSPTQRSILCCSSPGTQQSEHSARQAPIYLKVNRGNTMSRPRSTIRAMMVAVAVAALSVGCCTALWRRAAHYRRLAEYHALRSSPNCNFEAPAGAECTDARGERVPADIAAWHEEMWHIYDRAARYPWWGEPELPPERESHKADARPLRPVDSLRPHASVNVSIYAWPPARSSAWGRQGGRIRQRSRENWTRYRTGRAVDPAGPGEGTIEAPRIDTASERADHRPELSEAASSRRPSASRPPRRRRGSGPR